MSNEAATDRAIELAVLRAALVFIEDAQRGQIASVEAQGRTASAFVARRIEQLEADASKTGEER